MGLMRILMWTLRVIGFIFVIPIVFLFPGFFLLQIADEIENLLDRKQGKWR